MSTSGVTREWGDGERTAVLVHGLTGDAGVWFKVGPALAERGFHVHTVELSGHGENPSPATFSADTLVRAVLDQAPHAPDLALGHSLGGYTLLHALDALAPRVAVYVDPVLDLQAAADSLATYPTQKDWTLDDVRATYPLWPDEAHRRKWEALQRWDPTIVDALVEAERFPPAPLVTPYGPSLFVLADPSPLVPPERAAALLGLGHDVVTVRGAGHSVHHDRFEAFLAAVEPALDAAGA